MKDFLLSDLGRKFILTVVLIVAAFVFVCIGKISPTDFFSYAGVLVGGYGVLNVLEKFSPQPVTPAEVPTEGTNSSQG